MTPREKIAARARSLAAMTTANGCSEQEAITAAAKLADLLEAHNLSMDEVEVRANPFKRHDEAHSDAVGERLWIVASAVADLTGTRYWSSSLGVRPFSVSFFGFDHEAEIAAHLLAICRRAMSDAKDRVTAAYALMPSRVRAKVAAHLDGMAERLAQRIRTLKPKEPTGKGLIVLRNQLIADAMDAAGLKIKDGRGHIGRTGEAEYDRGRAAADRVGLNRGVASSPAPTAFIR